MFEKRLEVRANAPLPMMSNPRESVSVSLVREKGQRNLSLPKLQYEQIASLIFAIIEEVPSKKVTLQQLIEQAETSIPETFQGDAMWYLLQVKQDLEARGKLRVTLNRKRVQFIELTKGTLSVGYRQV